VADENKQAQSVLDRLVNAGQELGLQVAAYLGGQLVIDAWAGLADEPSGRPVDGNTLFTAFSISKGITATCIHVLADRGLVEYDAPIAAYWPEFAARGKAKATVRHALAHRVGIPQDPPGFDLSMAGDWNAVARATAELEPLWEPGTRTGYHPLTYGWMLGEVIRRVDGRSIAQFLQDEVCRPLEIDGMYFGIPPEAEPLVATLKNATERGIPGTTMNPSLSDPAGAFNRPEVRRAVIPGAGALVNARSLARHYAVLAMGGELGGVRLMSRDRIAAAGVPEFEGPDPILSPIFGGEYRWTLGYTLGGSPGPMAKHPNAIGYAGIGTIGFADPSREFAFAILKNLLDVSPSEMDSATSIVREVEDALGIA